MIRYFNVLAICDTFICKTSIGADVTVRLVDLFASVDIRDTYYFVVRSGDSGVGFLKVTVKDMHKFKSLLGRSVFLMKT